MKREISVNLGMFYRFSLVGTVTLFFLYIIKLSPMSEKKSQSFSFSKNWSRDPSSLGTPIVYSEVSKSKAIKKDHHQKRPHLDQRVVNDGYGDEVDNALTGQFLKK